MRRRTIGLSLMLALAGCGTAPPADDDAGVAPDVDSGPSGMIDAGPTTNPDSGPDDAGGGGVTGWRALAFPDGPGPEDRVTGVHCTAVDACVITTDDAVSSPGGFVFAVDGEAVTTALIRGEDIADTAGLIGSVGFIGLDLTNQGLVARADTTGAFVAAASDFTNPASWSAVELGLRDGSRLAAGNAQEAFAVDPSGRWLFANRQGTVYEASAPPGPTTVWTGLWSPVRVPPIPDGFADLLLADPTLCEMDVGTSLAPEGTQNVTFSRDLSVAVYPSAGLNQGGSAAAGVCISTDGGRRFYNVPFDGLGDEYGPIAVECVDENLCFAVNGLSFDAGSAYVYRTANASAGAASTWTRATIPTSIETASNARLRFVFFAPDQMHGWIGGNVNNRALLLRTTDGGLTWTDVSGAVQAVSSVRMHGGFALDADNIWLGGENKTLLRTDRAQD